jgi:hypothetical protein
MSDSVGQRRIKAVGIVVPVHNEERHIGAALTALETAVAHPDLADVICRIAVVLDSCSDDSAVIVDRWRRHLRSTADRDLSILVRCRSANVGKARQRGCRALLRRWGAIDPRHIWLATTDADSEVPSDWLVVQRARHAEGFDFWAGRVAVADWSPRPQQIAGEWRRLYDAETTPIHGANMGVSAHAYLGAGGFRALRTGEDRALHRAIALTGGSVCYDRQGAVVTSARRLARAPQGFAHTLTALEEQRAPLPTPSAAI